MTDEKLLPEALEAFDLIMASACFDADYQHASQEAAKTVRQALQRKAPVDVEALRKQALPPEHPDCDRHVGWNDCIDHLKGLISGHDNRDDVERNGTPEQELYRAAAQYAEYTRKARAGEHRPSYHYDIIDNVLETFLALRFGEEWFEQPTIETVIKECHLLQTDCGKPFTEDNREESIRVLRHVIEKALDWWDGEERHPDTMQSIRNEMREALRIARGFVQGGEG